MTGRKHVEAVRGSAICWLKGLATLIGSVSAAGCMASSPVNPLLDLLFSDVSTELSIADQQDITAAIGLELGDGGGSVVDPTCKLNAYPMVSLDDLNDDGSPEVFVQAGNTCSSGATGSSLWLFVRDSAGRLQVNFGFPALGYRPIDLQGAGFPDLELGGPGFCHPVWRWDGVRYAYLHNVEEEAGGCESRGP